MAWFHWKHVLSLKKQSFCVRAQYEHYLTQSRFRKLVDMHQRVHNYLRISLTDKCNLKCSYCMPASVAQCNSQKVTQWTPKEFLFLATYFVLRGVKKIRLTGGEPLLYPDLPDLIASLNSLRCGGLQHIAMTTNGVTFTRTAAQLKSAGLDSVNFSLDSLKRDKVTRLTGFPVLKHVLSSIHCALEHGYHPVKVNCVVMRGFNDDELSEFVQLTRNRPLEVRFIEYMPFGGNCWEQQKMLPLVEILHRIHEHHPNLERIPTSPDCTAKLYRVPGWIGKVGLITSMSANFCSQCTRLRLTSDGYLKTCLHSTDEENLIRAVREVNSNQLELGAAIAEHSIRDTVFSTEIEQVLNRLDCLVDTALSRKKAEHVGMDQLRFNKNRSMVRIGG